MPLKGDCWDLDRRKVAAMAAEVAAIMKTVGVTDMTEVKGLADRVKGLCAERDRLASAFPLRWSDEKPTVTGPYLHRYPSGRIKVGWFAADEQGGVWTAVSGSGSGCGYSWPPEMQGQWAGPIPLPIEPASPAMRVPADGDRDSIAEQYGEERFDQL